MTTTIVNKHTVRWAPYQVYCGRKQNGMHYCNPFSTDQHSLATVKLQRGQDAILACRQWLQGTHYQAVEPKRRLWILEHVHELKDHELVCFCAPKPCHAWLYAQLADGIPLQSLRLP